MKGKIKNLNNENKKINCKKIYKDIELMHAVESYLKTECYESYEKNNLKKAFEIAKHDDSIRLEIINIIDEFLFEDNNQKNMF